MIMQTCYSVITLLVVFQSVRGNQHATFDKNYSDRLAENNNQQSGLRLNNKAYHANAASGSSGVIASATDPSQASHETSHLAANKYYETNRFRRSSNGDDSGSSTETGPALNSGTITLPEDNDNAAKKPINFLRLFFCGQGYQNCMYDERLNNIQAQNDFLRTIPRMAEITLPTNYLDWKSKQLSLPAIKGAQITNSPGRRAFTADEPHYVLVRSDDANPRHLGPDFMEDPFIPQRGRRQSKAQTYDDPFYPMRGRRADAQAWDDPFFPMRGRRAETQAWDDPFFPMRGRRADNTWDDPFVPMRGRRRPLNGGSGGGKRAKTQPWDDPFIPMRGRRSKNIAKSIAYDDPFIPMRGRKDSDYDDVFMPMRGRRSIQPKVKNEQRPKRSLLASTGTFNAVYTPSEEVIVKLNGVQDMNKNGQSLAMDHFVNGGGQSAKAHRLIEGTTSHSVSNTKHQQHQKKSYSLLDDFATNIADDTDNGLMNDYATDYHWESPQMKMNKHRINGNQQRWMKSSRDLSQNRDAANLARGSGTSLLF